MTLRNITISIALWTLILTPLFCGLGVIVHACADEHASQCHHELDCDADPCQVLVLASSQRNDKFSDSDQANDFPGLPFSTEADPVSFSTHPPRLPGCEGLITELVDLQRSVPLLS